MSQIYKIADYTGIDKAAEDTLKAQVILKNTKIVLPAQQMLMYANMAADMLQAGFTDDQVKALASAVPLREMQSVKDAYTPTDTALGTAYIRHFEYGQSPKLATAFALNETKKEESQPQYNHPFLKALNSPEARIAASVLVGTGLVKLLDKLMVNDAYGTIMPTGSVDNSAVQYDWNIDMGIGEATIAISNIGTTPLTEFKLNIAEMLGYEAVPNVWHFTPESGTAKFTISGNLASLGNGESILINYTFNQDLVELTFDKLDYRGDDVTGTLDEIVTIKQIPEPATIGLLGFGAAVLALAKKRKSEDM